MRQYRYVVMLLIAALLGGCANSASNVVRYSGPQPSEEPQTGAAPQQAAQPEDAAEAARLAEQARQRDEAERQAREEAARLAREAEMRAEEQRRRELAQREADAEAARLAEQRRREEAAARAARELAARRARVEQLRAQIAANEDDTGQLEQANALLSEAVTAAESLVQALSEEREKYTATDPETGETLQPLDQDGIAALRAEVERLRDEAGLLMGQAGP